MFTSNKQIIIIINLSIFVKEIPDNKFNKKKK